MKLKKGDKVQIIAIALESDFDQKFYFIGKFDTIKSVDENKKFPYQLEKHSFYNYDETEIEKVK